MAQTTIPVTPINGGTLAIKNVNHLTYCRLTSTRHMYITAQNSPVYYISMVVDISNPKSSSLTMNLVKQQTITDIASPSSYGDSSSSSVLLVERLDDTHALLLASTATGKRAHVLEIASDGSVSVVASIDIPNVMSYIPFNGTTYGTGFTGSSICIEDNNVIVGSAIGTVYRLDRFVYSNGVLTTATVASVSTSSRYVGHFVMQRIPASSKAFVTLKAHVATQAPNTPMLFAYPQSCWIIDASTTTTVMASALSDANIRGVVALTEDTGVLVESSTRSRAITSLASSTLATPTATSTTSIVSSNSNHTQVTDWLAFNADYYCLFGLSGSGGGGYYHKLNDQSGVYANRWFRIIKYTDPNFSQASSATSAAGTNGATITGPGTSGAWLPTVSINYDSTNRVIFLPYAASSTSVGMRTIFLP